MSRLVVRKHFRFTGRVQGVGFRYHAVYKARELLLTGWVENLYDGSVEMEAQGEEAAIELLLDHLSRQRFIRIDGCFCASMPLSQDERDFSERGW